MPLRSRFYLFAALCSFLYLSDLNASSAAETAAGKVVKENSEAKAHSEEDANLKQKEKLEQENELEFNNKFEIFLKKFPLVDYEKDAIAYPVNPAQYPALNTIEIDGMPFINDWNSQLMFNAKPRQKIKELFEHVKQTVDLRYEGQTTFNEHTLKISLDAIRFINQEASRLFSQNEVEWYLGIVTPANLLLYFRIKQKNNRRFIDILADATTPQEKALAITYVISELSEFVTKEKDKKYNQQLIQEAENLIGYYRKELSDYTVDQSLDRLNALKKQ